MFTSVLQSWSRAQFRRVAALLVNTPLTPNMVTFTGFLINVLVGIALALGQLQWGAALILFAGVFDLLDGALARVKGQMSAFGGFFDSFLDRYSEGVIYAGLLIYYLRFGQFGPCTTCTDLNSTLLHYGWNGDAAANILLIFVVIVGSTMISYARARATAINVDCEMGLLPRTERIVLLMIALLLNLVTPALWILAIFSHVTAVQRLHFTWAVSTGRRPPRVKAG